MVMGNSELMRALRQAGEDAGHAENKSDIAERGKDEEQQGEWRRIVERVRARGRENNLEQAKNALRKIEGLIRMWNVGTSGLSREDKQALSMLTLADSILDIAELDILVENFSDAELGVSRPQINVLRATAEGIVASPEFHAAMEE